ncbi:disulfide bond formation protein B [Cohaesibacter celericrescens]|uniref:Disulfide bond formation protein B n=1 Tax=Cohaesibacter celericrescens TaxID=2067669 RepID=A0A2N5XUC9_9HYPH|nr:disulfide bond formation protein B [Cohaesibacter celericrescens]PLW78080.1 disulfide bond formation protein B [Cohaesibacter celericrescens]
MKLTAPIGNTQSLAASLLLLGALFISACSLGFEHIGGFQPCQLCYVQRHVHYAMIPLSAISIIIIMRGAPATMVRLLFVGLAGVLAYGAVVGFYQAGAEWEFWLGPNDCTNSVTITPDATNLMAQLQSTKLINCSVAQMRILGLSFGGWNVVLSTGLVTIALIGAFASKDALAPLFKRLPFLGQWMTAISKPAQAH